MKGTTEKTANKVDELRLLVNSRHPIISVETPEEQRIDALQQSTDALPDPC